MQCQTTQFGELKCSVVGTSDSDENVRRLVVLCHGFGASGDDLVSIGQVLLESLEEHQDEVRFVFPEAPLSMDSIGWPGARAWWMLDLEALQQAQMTGVPRDLSSEQPPGLLTAHAALHDALKAMCERWSLGIGDVVLGGFSQGSMVAVDVAIHLDEPVRDLWVLSGTLLWEERMRERLTQSPRLPVLISHGTQDAVLPYQGAVRLDDLLSEHDYATERITFHDGHTIPREALVAMRNRLAGDL